MAAVGSGEVKRRCRWKPLSVLNCDGQAKVGCDCHREVVKCERGLPVAALGQGESAILLLKSGLLGCEQFRHVLCPTPRAADTASTWARRGGWSDEVASPAVVVGRVRRAADAIVGQGAEEGSALKAKRGSRSGEAE